MKIITVSVLVLCTAVWTAASQAGSGIAQLPREIPPEAFGPRRGNVGLLVPTT